jgi:hypothetical protein
MLVDTPRASRRGWTDPAVNVTEGLMRMGLRALRKRAELLRGGRWDLRGARSRGRVENLDAPPLILMAPRASSNVVFSAIASTVAGGRSENTRRIEMYNEARSRVHTS